MHERPNILFLMSDEHRADVAGFAGDAVVRTPTLDRLARTGVVFENAYTPSPVCVPARQCLASGQLPGTNGCRGWVDLPPGSMTFARRLAQHGYMTACFGKLHHLGQDQMQGWRVRGSGDLASNLDDLGPIDEQAVAAAQRRFGDFKWSDAKEIRRAGVGVGPYVRDDRRWTNAACDYLDDYFANPYYDREQAGPLLLKLSLLQPHYPYFTDEATFTYYLNRVEPFLDEPVFDHPILSRRRVQPGRDASPREIRRATAAYYGMIETIDTHYAGLLAKLDHVGQDPDDWWIIYTSDHGEMLGEHGIWEKKSFFEAAARVPLVIRPPRDFREQFGCEGRRVSENVNLCDLFATLCDLAAVPLPGPEATVRGAGLDSRSLLPLLGDAASARAGWDDESISQLGDDRLMIKQGSLKYLYFRDAPEVLFDLKADPCERRNAIDDPVHAEPLSRFRRRRGDLMRDDSPA
jgi:choline-sulfatase